MYTGKVGTNQALEAVLGVMNIDTTHTKASQVNPNPVSKKECSLAVDQIKGMLPPCPEWVRGAKVVSIGGPNSISAVALRSLAMFPGGFLPGYSGSIVLEDDIPELLKAIAGKKNLENIAGLHEFAEPQALVVPKVVLFTAICEHCRITQVNFQPSIGSCGGVMVTDHFWQNKFRDQDVMQDLAAMRREQGAASKCKEQKEGAEGKGGGRNQKVGAEALPTLLTSMP